MRIYLHIILTVLLCSVGASAFAQSWTTQPDMKLKRSEASALDYKGQLFVFNGFSKGLTLGTSIEKYNPKNKQWTLLGNTSVANGTAVSHNGIVLVGNEAWLIGGRIGSHPGLVTSNVWLYNLDSNTWRNGPKLPVPMAGGGAALVDNKIYVFGGMDSRAECDVNFHYVYDLKKPSAGWKNMTGSAAMPTARNHFSTVVINNVIYAIGGQHNHDRCATKAGGNVAHVHSYTPKTNQWKRLADLPSIESHNEPSTFDHNGFIYTVGGATTGNRVLRFDPSKNQWQHIVNLPEALLAPVARIYDGRLVVAGGGAPITAKSKTQVRSIALAKFNDVAANSSNTTTTDNSDPDTNETTGETTSTNNALVISVEAESYSDKTGTNTHSWVNATLGGASAGKSMITTPNVGTLISNNGTGPKLTYKIKFPKAGTYHLWVRGWGDENANGLGGNDSLHAGLNGKPLNTADKIDGFPNGWHWSKRTRDGHTATLTIPSAGLHNVNLWMREDGFAVDKFLLVDNKAYVPSGTGPSSNNTTTTNTGTDTTTQTANAAPTVNAGANTTTKIGTPISLVGVISDDGQPNGALTSKWSKVSGPGTVVFSNANSASTNVSFSAAGAYVLRLTANDGSLQAADSVTITAQNTQTTTNNTDPLDQVGDVVTIEAERFTSKSGNGTHQWLKGSFSNASGGQSMLSTPNKGSLFASSVNSPSLSYEVNFKTAGTYHVWIRGWGDEKSNGQGGNDSVHAGLNNVLSPTADKIDGFPTGWHWSNRTRDGATAKIVVPSAGVHTFNLWMREDGFAVDKIILARKATFKPTGTGVVVSTDNTTTTTTTNTNTTTTNTDTTTTNTNTTTTNTNTTTTSAVLSVEAEDYFLRTGTAKHQWVNANLGGASANASMITTPNSTALSSGSANTPMMSYMLNFPSAGKYYLWVRGWGDEKSNGAGNNDSLHAGLNGKLAQTADKIDGFPAGWHWSRRTRDGAPATLTIPTKGTHSVNLWMREDGLAVDKFILARDVNYQPTGKGIASTSTSTTTTQHSEHTGESETSTNTTTTQNGAALVAKANRAWELVQTINGSAVAARHEAGAVVTNNRLYVLGGRGNRPVQSYQQSINRWTSHGKAPVLMHHFQPVAIGNKVYVIGAMKDDNFPTEKPLEHIYVFNTDNHTWSRSTAIPVNRRRGSVGAAAYKGKIYLVGGNTNGHSGPAVNWFDEYNPANRQWRTMPNAPVARDHATVAIANGKLVVAAGRRSKHPNVIGDTEARTDMFNFATGRWETTADNIPTQRAGTMTVAVGNEVVVIGGESFARVQAHDDVEALNVNTGKWRKLQPLLVGRHSGGAAVLGDKIQVVSGNTTRGGGNESISHETLRLDAK